jgi:hypothetical protein
VEFKLAQSLREATTELGELSELWCFFSLP